MTKLEREHLNKLSKEVLGTSSKWQKLCSHGEQVPVQSKNKKGEDISVTSFTYPTVEEMRVRLECKAVEMARKVKE